MMAACLLVVPSTSLEAQNRKDSTEPTPPVRQLKPVTNQIAHLKMNYQSPKALYEAVGNMAGIRVIFGPSYRGDNKAGLDLTDVTLSEALDYIALLTKTQWKPVGPTAILVAEDKPEHFERIR